MRAGGVIAYPTEGVFGLGCDPSNDAALGRLLVLKGRSASKGLILIAASVAQAMEHARALGPARMAAVLASWPGPVTWVLPARAGLSDLVTGGRDTIAVRVTAHPVAAALCASFGTAIVSTSANPVGRRPARCALSVRRRFPRGLSYVMPGGPCSASGPSEIRDGLSGGVLRAAQGTG